MTRYIDLAEYLWLAEQVTGVSAETLVKSSRIDLADSARSMPLWPASAMKTSTQTSSTRQP